MDREASRVFPPAQQEGKRWDLSIAVLYTKDFPLSPRFKNVFFIKELILPALFFSTEIHLKMI